MHHRTCPWAIRHVREGPYVSPGPGPWPNPGQHAFWARACRGPTCGPGGVTYGPWACLTAHGLEKEQTPDKSLGGQIFLVITRRVRKRRMRMRKIITNLIKLVVNNEVFNNNYFSNFYDFIYRGNNLPNIFRVDMEKVFW